MTIPADISATWEFLNGEVIWLHGRWSMYRQLFGTSEARIDVLNEVAPTFFSTLQSVLLDEVQLTLSRLSDPERSGRRQNVTLETLMNAIGALPESGLAAVLAVDLNEFRERCNTIVLRRNRRIAHYDMSTQRAAEGLPGASRQEIELALDGLRKFMTKIYSFYMNSYMAYEHFVLNDDANNIVRAAGEALRYRELIESGVIDNVDYVSSRYARI